jgi:glycosyltransferase involved in cell wall biosynthesis
MANSGWAWHLFAAPAIWIATLRGVPVVVNYRGGEADAFLARSLWTVRATIARARLLIVPSEYLRDVFAKYGMRTRIVPNIVDVNRFARKPYRAPHKCAHLIITRNLEAIYDIGVAIRAFAIIRQTYPDARLTIAGTGPERAGLEKLSVDLGVDQAIRFVGRLNREEIAELYRSADLMLNPSRIDNTPNSILEALATGVPVVTTNVGGIPYLVEDERTALLVNPADPVALAKASVRCLSDSGLARRLVANGQALVDQCIWPVVREALGEVYRDAVAATPKAHPR